MAVNHFGHKTGWSCDQFNFMTFFVAVKRLIIYSGTVLSKTSSTGFHQNNSKMQLHDRMTLQTFINAAVLSSAQSEIT